MFDIIIIIIINIDSGWCNVIYAWKYKYQWCESSIFSINCDKRSKFVSNWCRTVVRILVDIVCVFVFVFVFVVFVVVVDACVFFFFFFFIIIFIFIFGAFKRVIIVIDDDIIFGERPMGCCSSFVVGLCVRHV